MLPMNDATQGPPVPVGPAPEGQDMGPDAIKQQLKTLLTQAKRVAQQNGIDFSEIVSEVVDSKVAADVPLPRPPKP